MATLQWAMKLVDQFSPTAMTVAKRTRVLTDTLNATSTAADHVADRLKAAGSAAERMRDARGRFLPKGGGADALGRLRDPRGRFVARGGAVTTMIAPMKSAVDKAQHIDRSVGSIVGRLGAMGASLGTAVVGGAAAAGAAVMGVVAAVGTLGAGLAVVGVQGTKAFAKMAISAGAARENAMVAFRVMLKNDEAASRVYDQAEKFAARTPFATGEVVNAFQSLLAGGFRTDELEGMMTTIADMSAIKGPEQISNLIGAFSKLRATGKLTMETMERFRTAGLGDKMVAAAAGVAVSQLSTLKGDAAEQAVRKAIRQMFGGAADERAKTLSGMWSTFSSRAEELFTKAFKGGGGLSAWYDGMKSMLAWASDAFDPSSDTGQRIVGFIDRIGKVFRGVFGEMDPYTTTSALDDVLDVVDRVVVLIEGPGATAMTQMKKYVEDLFGNVETKDVVAALDGVVKVAGDAVKLFGAFAEGLGAGAKGPMADAVKLFGKVGEGKGSFDGLADALRIVGKALGTVSGGLVYIVALQAKLTALGWGSLDAAGVAFDRVGAAIGRASDFLGNFAWDVLTKGKSIGTSLVDGMIVGITDAIGGVVDAARRMASAAVGAAKDALSIHSPSRVMADLGGFTSRGFARGIEASTPEAQDSMLALVAPPTPKFARSQWAGAVPSMPASDAPSGGGTTITFGPITIHGSGSADDVKQGLLAALEQVGFEAGVVGGRA